MSQTLTRWRARCEGCKRGFTDTSKKFIEQAAEAHEDECDQIGGDDEVVVEEV